MSSLFPALTDGPADRPALRFGERALTYGELASAAGAVGRASASRWYIVGTPNSMVAPSLSSRATPSALNLPRCRTEPPRRSGPSVPRTSPCTWNSGSPCTSTSSAVHCQASARASRVVASARRGRTAPLGGPVVPEV